MNMPFFSIIIPTYNRSNFIGKAVESITSQSFSDWEVIIIDDGSTDDTTKVIGQINDQRVKYFWQNNQERSAARNNGIRISKGKYLFFLDSDDILLPGCLTDCYDEIISRRLPEAMFFVKIVQMLPDGKLQVKFDVLPMRKDILKFIFSNALVVPVSQAFIHRNLLEHNRFEERFSLWEDTHLYLRLLAQYPYFSCNISCVKSVKHDDSTVEKGLRYVRLIDVKRYLSAISDLQTSYWWMFQNKLEKCDFAQYIDSKLNMYLYQSRINHQYRVAFQISRKMITNRFSCKNLMTVLKLQIHYLLFLSHTKKVRG